MESNRNSASRACFVTFTVSPHTISIFSTKNRFDYSTSSENEKNIFILRRKYVSEKNCSSPPTSNRAHKKWKMKNFFWKFRREFRHCEFKFQCQISELVSKIHPLICCRDKIKHKTKSFQRTSGSKKYSEIAMAYLKFSLSTFCMKLALVRS